MEDLRYGLLEQKEVFPKDWRMGSVSGSDKTVLKDDGDYTEFLPKVEYQIGLYFDTLSCVTFSALNSLEILAKVNGLDWNRSDRFTSKMSGTTKEGNYLRNVAESIRLQGTVDEAEWPYPRTQRTPIFDWDDFYASIPLETQQKGLQWLEDYVVQWEWIRPEDAREALKYGPVQVGVRAWPKPLENGLYDDGGSTVRNHAVTLYNATDEYFEIFDHYSVERKKLVPGYDFRFAMQYSIVKKKPMTMVIKDNTLVQDVEGTGQFGMALNGKIMVGDAAEVLATVTMRSDVGEEGGVVIKRMPLNKADWASFPKVDMKNRPIE